MSKNSNGTQMVWATSIISLVLAIAFLIAAWAGGQPWLGVGLLVLFVAFAIAVIVARRRSETIKGLLDRRDERIATIDLKATATAGVVLIVAVLIGAVVEVARGHTGMPYVWLGALAGIAYIVTVIVERFRG